MLKLNKENNKRTTKFNLVVQSDCILALTNL